MKAEGVDMDFETGIEILEKIIKQTELKLNENTSN